MFRAEETITSHTEAPSGYCGFFNCLYLFIPLNWDRREQINIRSSAVGLNPGQIIEAIAVIKTRLFLLYGGKLKRLTAPRHTGRLKF